MNQQIAFKINGKPIGWPYRGKVIKMLRGDINLAGRVFYRCKVACEKNPDLNPYKWIHTGLMGEDEYA